MSLPRKRGVTSLYITNRGRVVVPVNAPQEGEDGRVCGMYSTVNQHSARMFSVFPGEYMVSMDNVQSVVAAGEGIGRVRQHLTASNITTWLSHAENVQEL